MKVQPLLPNIIDALSESVQRFGITRNKKSFDEQLDFIVLKMNTLNDDDEDWKILQTNYSKLKYLYEIINFYNLPTSGKFIESLKLFMETIDKKNQYYLREINWCESDIDIGEKVLSIKENIEASLNITDPIIKLDIVLKTYQILIPIVENVRNEKCNLHVEREFIKQFSPKRQKKN